MHSDLPRVRDGALQLAGSATDDLISVLVGSVEWFHLLDQLHAFAFEDHCRRSFTARREHRHQLSYWYAYRKHHNKLHKFYLGKSQQLDLPRLHAAARHLDLPSHNAQPLPSRLPTAHHPAAPHSPEQLTLDPLRAAKLRVPASAASLLQRPRLTQRLDRSPQNAPAAHPAQTLLTVITAPAGYGKTTLLAQWLASRTLGRGLSSVPNGS
jgi:LuxR family maltose regulon positive regulatory protein